jgi:DNA polymerase V
VSVPQCVALIDCDAFYCSCQVAFEPQLAGRPLVVLSQNDGNIIARSAAAKAIGVAMGAPAFEYRQLIEQDELVCRSANFALYAELSGRVMEVLATFGGPLEVYSIVMGRTKRDCQGSTQRSSSGS